MRFVFWGSLICLSVGFQNVHAQSPDLRVLLFKTTKPIHLESQQPLSMAILSGSTSKMVSTKESAITIKFTRKGIQLGRSIYQNTVQIQDPMQMGVKVNQKTYRGAILLRWRKDGIYVVNQLPMEWYLQGVVPRESKASWPLDTLKAQAVVSRTFATANRSGDPSKLYDLRSDVLSQVYGGMDAETESTNQAILETQAQILIDENDKPVQTYFHSACGGKTEAANKVWYAKNLDVPYLTTINDGDYCQESPHSTWAVRFAETYVRRKIEKLKGRLGTVKKISLSETSPSGRAREVRIDATKKSIRLSGQQFRMLMGPENLRSTFIQTIEVVGGYFRFVGHGWGHGVGLCQWGARGRALKNQTYEQILLAYYPNTHLDLLD